MTYAAPPPAVPPPLPGERPSPSPDAPDVATPGGPMPNDEFIEFLGEDDVGDAAWWEFLKKSAPRKEQPPVPPPQDAKQ